MFKIRIIIYWLKIKFKKPFTSREELIIHQDKKLKSFTKKILSKSAFYKKYTSDNIFNWNVAPLMEKELFMNSFNEINTVNINLDTAMNTALKAEATRDFKSEINGITVGLSTGTSGKRGLFLVSEKERALWVALIMNRVIKPSFVRKQKVAFFLRANSNLYTSVESSLFEFKYFDIFKSIETLIDEVNSFQPDILAAQPSILTELALAKQKGICIIKPVQIISFAEVLHEENKRVITSTFDCKIREVYQCTEGFLGASCEYGTIHLNEDFIRFEEDKIDEQRFRPIITDFSRESQLVVKYRMNDILIKRSSPCPCGSILMGIEKIVGRDDDVLIFKNTKQEEVKIFPDLIARRIAISTNDFLHYNLIQVSMDTLNIYLSCEENLREQTESLFEKSITNLLEENSITKIKININATLHREAGSKNRKIQRTF